MDNKNIDIPRAVIDIEVQLEFLTTLVHRLIEHTNLDMTHGAYAEMVEEAKKTVIAKYPEAKVSFGDKPQ
ncbi:MAG: hypothetical protein EOO20_05040 [Chryseobacterium sp.]|nr:MAG: hypothetical protein EOO20_05040 [Chryseobacterium sp.]